MPKCPRSKCKNGAVIDPVYKTLPCKRCQESDSSLKIVRPSEAYSLAKSHRIQQARDVHSKDTVQPYLSNKPNPDYFRIHPDQVNKYNVRQELEKM